MPDDRQFHLTDPDRRRLIRAAARLLGPADAEDAVHDAIVRALEAEAPLDVAPAWLSTVVRRLAIDRLRRRLWLQLWSSEWRAFDEVPACPSAEANAALMQETGRALRLLAAHLTPTEGAEVLLHAVFEFSHAELAHAGARSEAGSRQRLRRALSQWRHACRAPSCRSEPKLEPDEETVFQAYWQSLQRRDPEVLLAMVQPPTIGASSSPWAAWAVEVASAPHVTTCRVARLGGQLGLVLTLDGVLLCVLPLGVRVEMGAHDVALA